MGDERGKAVSRIGADARSGRVEDVTLAPLSLEHAEATLRWLEDPELARGLGLRRAPSMDATRAWIEAARARVDRHPFAVVAAGTHVGNVVLDLLDEHLGTARLSIYVGEREARGAGIAQSAVSQAADHAAEVLGLHKLWLTVHVGNAPALAAYARCGFVVEGVLRDEFILDGHRTDVVRMGLLLGRPPR